MPWVRSSGAARNEPTAVGNDVCWSDFSKSEFVIFHLHYREKLWKRPENDQSARRHRDQSRVVNGTARVSTGFAINAKDRRRRVAKNPLSRCTSSRSYVVSAVLPDLAD